MELFIISTKEDLVDKKTSELQKILNCPLPCHKKSTKSLLGGNSKVWHESNEHCLYFETGFATLSV